MLNDTPGFRYLVNIVSSMHSLRGFNSYEFCVLNKYLNNLWEELLFLRHDFNFDKETNSESIFQNEISLFGIALNNCKDNFTKQLAANVLDSNMLNYLTLNRPTAVFLLNTIESDTAEEYTNVYKLFLLSEKYIDSFKYNFYPYRLYTKAFKKITKIICKIYGLIFNYVSNIPYFFQAWMIENLMDLVLPFDEKDVVTKIFYHISMADKIKLEDIDLNYVYDIFSIYQNKDKMPVNIRLMFMLNLCYSNNYIKYDHGEIIRYCNDHNTEYPKNKINIKAVKSLLNKSEKLHLQEQKAINVAQTNNGPYCSVTGNYISKGK